MIGAVETIAWHPASTPPDDDTTVLISISGGSEPVWLGYLGEDGGWRQADASSIEGVVVAWADVPEGWFPGVAP